ncbi:hypothetical protein JCM8208_001297 [Rhodotorula glutinis]
MSAPFAPPPPGNPPADRIGGLDLGVVLRELHRLPAAVSGMDDRRRQRYLETAIGALVQRVQRNLETDGVWRKLAALDPLRDPPRTFQGAVYFSIYHLYGDLRSGKVGTSVQVVQASQAISNLIVRGWLQPKLQPAAPLVAVPPRPLAFCYLHSALENISAAASSSAHGEAIQGGVQVGVAHLARALSRPQWEELANVDPALAPPATYQAVVLRQLHELSHALGGVLSLEALEAHFNTVIDTVNKGKNHFVALRDSHAPATHSIHEPRPPQLISDHRARMYGVSPADLAGRWA